MMVKEETGPGLLAYRHSCFKALVVNRAGHPANIRYASLTGFNPHQLKALQMG